MDSSRKKLKHGMVQLIGTFNGVNETSIKHGESGKIIIDIPFNKLPGDVSSKTSTFLAHFLVKSHKRLFERSIGKNYNNRLTKRKKSGENISPGYEKEVKFTSGQDIRHIVNGNVSGPIEIQETIRQPEKEPQQT